MTASASGRGAVSRHGDVRPPDLHADEKTTLLTFLDYLRESIVVKAAGLDDASARRTLVPSGTSLAWLLKHLAADRTPAADRAAGSPTGL